MSVSLLEETARRGIPAGCVNEYLRIGTEDEVRRFFRAKSHGQLTQIVWEYYLRTTKDVEWCSNWLSLQLEEVQS